MLSRLLGALLLVFLMMGTANAETIVGIASYYGKGDGFHGRRTACGQVFNAYGLTAAHRKLPCGTRLQVYLADHNGNRSGKAIIVTVNDRGPFIGNRILDLSYGAASALGFVRAGTAKIVGQVLR